ncbi:MAG: hypothetical protein FD152_3931 [Xanthobacteraceae bacterium]|nr:MAG: hypothetical protein FD152_3931 [Xanthobacteraceae bacterium]
MLGMVPDDCTDWNGMPVPWNRPSRSKSVSASISLMTSSVGKSSTRMTTPLHRLRKSSGRSA